MKGMLYCRVKKDADMAWNDDLEDGTPAHEFASADSKTIRTVAGPGSGKSFAIGRRIARLLESGMSPQKILAITFTRTAAKDLKDDISALDVEGSENVRACTIHSLALSIIMRDNVIEQTGRNPRMILDHEIAPALRDLDDTKFGDVRNKKALLDAYLAAWATLQNDDPGFAKDTVQQSFEDQLIEWMKSHDGMLVGEVIPVAIDHLKFNPESSIIGSFDVILVDEYQDLNKAEQEFIRLIRGDNNSLVIVGDDDQSIYRFKFAHPEGIRTVDEVHGEYIDIPFDQCRRCPIQVTALASTLISQNPDRTLGELQPFPGNAEGVVQIVQWPNSVTEVSGISTIIANEIQSNKIEPKDVIVLTPRRLIGYELRDTLLKLDVPTKSYFRESSIKKQVAQIAYSSIILAAFPEDKVSLRFLIGVDGTNFRNKQYTRVSEAASEKHISVAEMLNLLLSGEESISHTKQIVDAYSRTLDETKLIRDQIENDPDELFEKIFEKDAETAAELYELKEIYRSTLETCGSYSEDEHGDFERWLQDFIGAFQKEVANPEIPDEIDHVRVMSLHSSKGLSSKLVVVCSAIDELIPGKETSDEHIQEQRRLFYVAITRCKASDEYPGRLIVSSFVNIPGQMAVQLDIPAKANQIRKVRATRFLKDLGANAPKPQKGKDLLN